MEVEWTTARAEHRETPQQPDEAIFDKFSQEKRSKKEKAKEILEFAMNNTDGLLKQNPRQRKLLGKESELWIKGKYLLFLIAFLVVVGVVFTKIKLVGSKKGESIKFDQDEVMKYPMDSSLLPIHHFSTFDRSDITNLMECLVSKNPEACTRMCDISIDTKLRGVDWRIRDTNKIACYLKNNVPASWMAATLCM